MAKTSGLFRVGHDAKTHFLADGTAVANVSIAFNFGKPGQDGKRPTQWIDAAIFGKRAEVLAPMLNKGSQHVFHLSDCHIESFTKNDGTQAVKMVGRVDDVELTDRRDGAAPAQPRPAPQPAPRQAAPQRTAAPAAGGFADMDDDIPFANPMASRAFCLVV